jgi:hypothetical protein
MWFLTLRKAHRLKVFENRMLRKVLGPKREEVSGDRRKLHVEQRHDLYCTPNGPYQSVCKVKENGIGDHVVCVGEKGYAYRFLVGAVEWKRTVGRPRPRREFNTKMDLK